MSSFFNASRKIITKSTPINFYNKCKYEQKKIEIFEHWGQVFCYKIYIPNEYITKDIDNGNQSKILKITDNNKKYFQPLNYIENYLDNKNHEWYYCYDNSILRNFDGIDATKYTKEDNDEILSEEGIIWDTDKINIKLIDFIYLREFLSD